MQTARERERAEKLSWEDLERLWQDLRRDAVAGWRLGKAFEHLVMRAFSLSGLRTEYPYNVPVAGHPLEQIDGLVYLRDTPFLVECKDRSSADIGAIAKMRNQLARRPPATMGCVFVSGAFSDPAVILTNFAAPHRITLWDGTDVAEALTARDFASTLARKYHDLCMFGLTDQSSYYREVRANVR